MTRDTAVPAAPETQIVREYRVSCDGGEGALGHPRVWLSLPRETGRVTCGYCDKLFIHEDHVDATEQGAAG